MTGRQSMVKKLIRGAIRRARRWLEEEPDETAAIDQNKHRYHWLNVQCLKILEHHKRKPSYVWGVIHGAGLAQILGLRQISVVEFGVAGGNGLIALQDIAVRVEEIFGVEIGVYGFDTGAGLPKPTDYRDLPNLFSEGLYPMAVEKLRPKLNKAHLILGPVENTLADFIHAKPTPIAFVSFDLDLYTSTKQAFALFEADHEVLLPRVHCYFDDILGYTYSEFTGELLAIAEFNASHKMRKISKINGLKHLLPPRLANQRWPDKFYLAHIFDHELYGHYDGLNSTDIENRHRLLHL
jgi:hypothetical protein